MKTIHFKTTLALAIIGAGLAALPAYAVQSSFSGSSNVGNLDPVNGTDGLGNTWYTSNGPALQNSSFTMADSIETPQPFNPLNFSNGLGNFANSFQLTVNRSQNSLGFSGLNLGAVASGLVNEFIVMPTADSSTWVYWVAQYSLLADNGFYQQVLFTAPDGSRLTQGENFAMNINFNGIMTNDSGWAASWDDRAAPSSVPEPGSMALLGIGLLGMLKVSRRKNKV